MKNRRFFVQQRTERQCTGFAWHIPTVILCVIIPISSIILYYTVDSRLTAFQNVIGMIERYVPVLIVVRIGLFEENFFEPQMEWLRLAYAKKVHIGSVLYKTVCYLVLVLVPYGVVWLRYQEMREYIPAELCKTVGQCLFFAFLCYALCYLFKSGILALCASVGYYLICGFYPTLVSLPSVFFGMELWHQNYVMTPKIRNIFLAAAMLLAVGIYLNKLYLAGPGKHNKTKKSG